MALTTELISQFVKATKDASNEPSESTVYATVVKQEGTTFVQIDGSTVLTPVIAATNTVDGERVIVTIKNHTAIITGNLTSPSARFNDIKDQDDRITELEIAIAYRVTTEDLQATNAIIDSLKATTATIKNADIANAEIEKLRAEYAEMKYITADEIEALNATIENIEAIFGDFADLSTEQLEAINADIERLRAYNADFTYVSAEVLQAMKASIKSLDTEKLDAETAQITYANIDFSNIGQAAMEYFYANSGLIENVIIDNGSITGTLVGVTIKGDTIEANTVVADKLVIQGEDGLFYKLNTNGIDISAEQTEYNSLDGKVILAKSITATQINVEDLVAFDATIGGFNITENSIYSEVKDDEGNTTRGIYMDRDGQFNFGDGSNYVKYYRDDEGNYRLAISADTIMYNINGGQRSLADLGIIGEYVKIGTYEDEPCIELGELDSDFKLVITNTKILFMEGTSVPAYISNQSLFIRKAVIEEELQQGEFIWKARSNGNLGLIWKGVNS